jgi:hypothetical protein
MKIFGYDFNIQNVNKAQPESVRVISKVVENQMFRVRQDILNWRNALIAAENSETPSREFLYQLYADVVLDAHLSSVMESKWQKILSKEFKIVDEKGEEVVEKTRIL